MIKVSAPGKVHLVGEHSVVYGEPAILASISLRCYVTAEKSGKVIVNNGALKRNSVFTLDEINYFNSMITNLWKEGREANDFSKLFKEIKKEPLNHNKVAIGKILEKLEIVGGVSLTIKSDIPIGAGAGSGAALAVSLVKAISELYERKLTNEKVNELAFEIEKISHGNPSGGDNSTCCHGGLIWFQKNSKNTVVPLKEEIGYKLENFVLVVTKKVKPSTGELIQHVRNLDEDYRNERIGKLGKLTKEMRAVLKNKNFNRMKQIINDTQKILAEIGVSTSEIDKINSDIMSIGGAAKLCGAGGGGVVLCYHENKKKLIETIKKLGYEPLEVYLGVEGVRIE